MAIGITTMTGMNYGSALQAYSLQTTFQNFGVDSYTIQLRPRSYLLNFLRKYFFPNDEWNFRTRMWRFKSDIIYSHKSKLIKKFWDENTFTHYYHSRSHLKKGEESTKVLLAGSDQIWNPAYIPNYLYYLMFANQNSILYSYAVSLATDVINKDAALFYRDRLKSFSGVSVREQTGKVLLSECIENEIRVDLDPIFLLEKEYWDSFASDRFKDQKYIFLYVIKPNLELCSTIKKIAAQYNLRIYYIGDFSAKRVGVSDINNASVEDFLSLIKYASAVVTNSFHATAFSILMNKQFFSYVPPLSGSRIRDVLDTFDLMGQIIDEDSVNESIDRYLSGDRGIDYSKVNPIIAEKRVNSLEYLRQIAEVDKCT